MIITLCGSYKFVDEMLEIGRKLTEKSHIVLYPAIGCKEHDIDWYLNLHFQKIEMSDAIFVVDIIGYIGESVTKEIERAMMYGKRIFRWSDVASRIYLGL